MTALSDADRLVGRLAGEGGRLPNPHLLIRPFIRREAVLSSKIEGTQATLGERLAAEAGMAVDRSPDDLREVASYVVALEHGIARLPSLPLSVRLVRELHGKLMTGVRGDRVRPGDFRNVQNWIGPAGRGIEAATYVPPPPDQLLPCLDAWEKFLHDRSLPPLIQAALVHYQFEAIHPFVDGNGRVGRLLITLFLVERQVLPAPLSYLSAFFEANRQAYYARLQGVHERGEWEAWLAERLKVAFTRGGPTERTWYYDLSGVKVGKKTPLTVAHFEEFFRLLPERADGERSWTVRAGGSRGARVRSQGREPARPSRRGHAHPPRSCWT